MSDQPGDEDTLEKVTAASHKSPARFGKVPVRYLLPNLITLLDL